MSCLVIAEAGVNHNGILEQALELVNVAADAGADIVKFQTFKTEALVTKSAGRASYQNRNLNVDGSQFEMLKKLELTEKDFIQIHAHCEKKKIKFLSTPFDFESLNFLVREGLIDRIKVPSGEVTNLPFILEMAKTQLPIILSTGMATLTEIEKALAVISFGYLNSQAKPGLEEFWKCYWSSHANEVLGSKVTILHCTTEYPALPETINLKAMDTLKAAFSVPIGYSDHSRGIHIPIAAVARGATIIEKHYTLDRNMVGPDHKASLEPLELKEMISNIRELETALGDGRKVPAPIEIENRKVARKVLVASKHIQKGEKFTPDNLKIKRNGEGLLPEFYWYFIGQHAEANYNEGEAIKTGANL